MRITVLDIVRRFVTCKTDNIHLNVIAELEKLLLKTSAKICRHTALTEQNNRNRNKGQPGTNFWRRNNNNNKNIGLPHKMIVWINSFLRDRRAKVRINNTLSKSRSFKQGVPQGAVLSPLLFLVYINDITETFSAEEICQTSMFADDIAVWCTHRSKESATMKLQLTIDKITSWSKRWKLELNPLKCETMLFTQDPGEVHWDPQLTLDGERFVRNPNPTFLGITYDRD